MLKSQVQCGVCGGTRFTSGRVLWKGLIDEWQLSKEEVEYIDRQQAEICDGCKSSLRNIALANALRAFFATQAFLRDVPHLPAAGNVAILEINEAGTLTPILRKIGRHIFGAYPKIDLHALPYENSVFDIVVHSDTLEHVKNPVQALTECRRVLKSGGALCFTVPIVVGRLSRSRDGLPKSYHGNADAMPDDLVVQTEFGADAWTYAMQAGFTDVSIHAVGYPAATALLARNGWGVRT